MIEVESFTTEGLAPRQRRHFWSEVTSRTFTQLESRPRYPDDFSARLHRVSLGALSFSQAISGWMDPKYTELDVNANASGIFLSNKFNNTPQNTFSLTVDYELGLSGGAALTWHAGYAWRDDQFNDATNTPLVSISASPFAEANAAMNGVAAT